MKRRSHNWGQDLYIIQQKVTGCLKVGRTNDIERRLDQLQTGSPYELKVIIHIPHKGNLERDIHTTFREYKCWNKRGEWFYEDALASLPIWIYEMLDLENQDWWVVK